MNEEDPRPRLGHILHGQLCTRYGSIYRAAENIEIPYERLKKAVQRNIFSRGDLAILMPDEDVRLLEQKYMFRVVRPYGKKQIGAKRSEANIEQKNQITDVLLALITKAPVIDQLRAAKSLLLPELSPQRAQTAIALLDQVIATLERNAPAP